MKKALSRGLVFFDGVTQPHQAAITLRMEKTGDFITISLSDDDKVMIQAVVNGEFKKILKDM